MSEQSQGGPFSVHQVFFDGSHECLLTTTDPEAAVQKARDYIFRPAAKIGLIQRVIITDRDTCNVFEWKYGEGVVHPKQERKA